MTILRPGSFSMGPTVARANQAMLWTGRRITILATVLIPIVVVFLFFDPYPQPAAYYQFADNRAILGIPNFWNVASNLLFLVFGVRGLQLVLRNNQLVILPDIRATYVVLFIGILLTAFGSGWFHLSPDNDRLFWDRLPMTVAFMSLFAIIVGEHVSADLARNMLVPLVLVGAASVFYWDYSESIGAGDLRFYGIVQFLPMLLIPLILILYKSAFSSVRFLWWTLGVYALAKILEAVDGQLFGLGSIISGHSLKHIAASLVPLVLIQGMRNRQRIR